MIWYSGQVPSTLLNAGLVREKPCLQVWEPVVKAVAFVFAQSPVNFDEMSHYPSIEK